MLDDFNTPNTAPGYCPECGLPANIWEAVSQTWECSLCSWKGRAPNPNKPIRHTSEHQPEYMK
jgi:ribosomal protein L37AE/L43A